MLFIGFILSFYPYVIVNTGHPVTSLLPHSLTVVGCPRVIAQVNVTQKAYVTDNN